MKYYRMKKSEPPTIDTGKLDWTLHPVAAELELDQPVPSSFRRSSLTNDPIPVHRVVDRRINHFISFKDRVARLRDPHHQQMGK
jgi:hypothetical protein